MSLTSNSLLNPFQSAYTKFYSTMTTLLSLHDHLSNVISMQQFSCLCLPDLSAAFDTLDHSILLHRLSTWFDRSSVSEQWFTSYLSSRTSTVGIPSHSSPFSHLTCEVPQGSVLCSVLFNLYTTPLSYLISASSISHLQYADDTQHFLSFVPTKLSSAINNIQSTITLISSWMSSNFLTLSPSKTEFLLIGLPRQTSKTVNPSLSLSLPPFHQSLNAQPVCLKSRFHIDSTLSFSKQISSLSSACHYQIHDLRRMRHSRFHYRNHNSHCPRPFTPRLL